MEKSNETFVQERINGKQQQVYEEMVNLIGVEGSLINLLFSIKKYYGVLSPLEARYFRHVKLAHERNDGTATIEDVKELFKILHSVRNSE